MSKYISEYKMIFKVLTTEAGSFWSRFSIFVAFKSVALIAIFKEANVLANHNIIRPILYLLVFITAVFMIVSIRSCFTINSLHGLLRKFEQDDKTDIYPLFQNFPEKRVPQNLNLIFTSAIYAAFLFFDIYLLIVFG